MTSDLGIRTPVSSQARTSQVELRFADGETRVVEVAAGETVLAAARRLGFPLVSQCTVGTCCTCAASLTDGEADMPEDCITALTSQEVAAGQRLLCQTKPATDAIFELDYPSSLLAANPPRFFSGKILRLTWVNDATVELTIRVPKALRLKFTAGQYCRIKVPGTQEWRSYSMASGEHEQGKLTFLIRVLPQGAMSDFLRDGARSGLSLELEGPLGGFVLEPDSRPHLMIAGGTGLAPILSMLAKLRLIQPAPPILLVFGCLREQDLFLLEELAARRSYMDTLSTRIAVEESTSNPGLIQGNPVEVLRDADLLPNTVAYLCGPPGMIAAAQDRLLRGGLDPTDIRAEQFLPS